MEESEYSRKLVLGIDTGGTYTDGVLLDYHTGEVLRSAKTLTTYDDLSCGIAEVIKQIANVSPSSIRMVSVSTTLATNSIVEGRGGKVCLLLLGYDRGVVESFGLDGNFATDFQFYVPGGHTIDGAEKQPLDEDYVIRIVEDLKDTVDSFAISGYFSVHNPAHELRCRDLVRSVCDSPVVCGHELTGNLNAVKRAATAVLNARLVPTIHRLLLAIRKAMAESGINAPLYIVKGDGSLLDEEAAALRPIETILSGPAASVVGGKYLAGVEDCLVADMGGTTTDIALLRGGQILLDAEGAEIEGWQTSVRAVGVRTLGLGGDSWVRATGDGKIEIGPHRVTPLSLAATLYPDIRQEMRRLALRNGALTTPYDATFLIQQQKPGPDATLGREEQAILRLLENGPSTLARLARTMKKSHPSLLDVARLESRRIVGLIGLTLTDVLHADGSDDRWDRDAAALGVNLLCKTLGRDTSEFVGWIREEVTRRLWLELLRKGLGAKSDVKLPGCHSCRILLDLAFASENTSMVDVTVKLKVPVVAVGAPVSLYFPEVARRLGTNLIIPKHWDVANAVGSAVGNVLQEVVAEVYRERVEDRGQDYVVQWPGGLTRADGEREALILAETKAADLARDGVEKAGGKDVRLKVNTEVFRHGYFFHAKTRAIAVGRPRVFSEDAEGLKCTVPESWISVKAADET